MNLLKPLIELKKFLKIKEDEDTTFVFRGMITYYGKHYMAFFYAQIFD